MYTVFLSYKRGADVQRAQVVRAKLEAIGVKVFQDIDMRAGGLVSHILDAQLNEALAVLVLWTQASFKSQWVAAEAHKGLNRGVLVTSVFDHINCNELMVPFNHVHTPDLSDWIESGAPSTHYGWRSVVAGLGGLLKEPLLEIMDADRDEVLHQSTANLTTSSGIEPKPPDLQPRQFALRIVFENKGLKSIIVPLEPGPGIEARMLGARGAALGKGPLAAVEVSRQIRICAVCATARGSLGAQS